MTRTRTLLVGLAALALLLAGCDGDTIDDPEEALEDALEALADSDGVTIESTILSDADSLVAASEGAMEEDEAQALLDGAVRTSFGFETEAFELAVDHAGGELLALRVPGGGESVFARVDTEALFDVADVPEGERAEIEMGISGFLGFAGFPTESLFAGDWIEISGLDELGELAEGEAEEADDAFEGIADDVLDAFDELYEEHITVETGEDDGQVVVSVPLREAMAFVDEVSAMGAEATGGFATPQPDLDEIPDEEIRIDVWLDGGELSRVELDIVQIAEWEDAGMDGPPEGVSQLGLAMDFTDFDGDVEAPADAAAWDIGGMMDGLEGMFGPGPEPLPPEELDDLDDMDDMGDMGDLDDAVGDAGPDGGFAGMAAEMLVGFTQQSLAGEPADDLDTWDEGIDMVLQDPDVSVEPVTDDGRLVALQVADSFDDSVVCVLIESDSVDDVRIEPGECPMP